LIFDMVLDKEKWNPYVPKECARCVGLIAAVRLLGLIHNADGNSKSAIGNL